MREVLGEGNDEEHQLSSARARYILHACATDAVEAMIKERLSARERISWEPRRMSSVRKLDRRETSTTGNRVIFEIEPARWRPEKSAKVRTGDHQPLGPEIRAKAR